VFYTSFSCFAYTQLMSLWPCLADWSDAHRFHLAEAIHRHNASLAALFRLYVAKSAAASSLSSNRGGGGGGHSIYNSNGGMISIDMFLQWASDAQALDAHARSSAQVCFSFVFAFCIY
jgi:hypothetical protein